MGMAIELKPGKGGSFRRLHFKVKLIYFKNTPLVVLFYWNVLLLLPRFFIGYWILKTGLDLYPGPFFYALKCARIIFAFEAPTALTNSSSLNSFIFFTDLNSFNKLSAVFFPIPLIISNSFLKVPVLLLLR